MAIVTCVGGGGGGGSAPQRNDDAPRTLRGGSAGGGGGWSQSKIILNGFNQMEIIVGAGGTSGYWGWYTYADGKSIKAYTNSLAEYTPPTALSTLQVLPGGVGGISQVKYKSFCMCYAGGGTSGLTDTDYSGSGNKSGGIGGLGDINGSQGGYGCGSSQSSGSGGDAPDITDKGIGGGGGGGMVSAITVGNGGDGSGFKPSNYPGGSQGRGAGGYKFVEDGDGQTTNA